MAMVEESKPAGSDDSAAKAAGMFSRYKPDQGHYARQIAFWVLLGLNVYGCFSLNLWLNRFDSMKESLTDWQLPVLRWTVNPALLVSLTVFVGFWVFLHWYLNRPKSADLLIETEGEMKKVTWPSFGETIDASLVVIGTVVLLGLFVTLFDRLMGVVMNFLLYRGQL